FDSTWNATGVDPSAPWDLNGDGVIEEDVDSTQSENPANYVGWVQEEIGLIHADRGYRDELTRSLDRDAETIESEALVLQSFFWDGAIVGTYGWRRDVDEAYSARATEDPDTNMIDFDTLIMPDEPYNVMETQSNSWSVAVHANELLGLE